MTKRTIRHIGSCLALAVMLWTAAPLRAQEPVDVVDTSYFQAVDAANYDSLLHFFYMEHYRKSAHRHLSRKVSQMYAEFDNIPDSVFIERLGHLKTVVPLTYNAEVRAYIKLYVRIMSHRLEAMLSLSEYYFPLFEATLDRYGVPEELKYLTIVESALNPMATSRAGAAGLWQFMYATGKNYDLEINSLVDERRDPFKSTVAAARYLHALYNIYGDWQLAMAAYNCGPGNVNKAITRAGGKHTFWEIYPYLPRETRGYIPKYIGAAYVMNYYHEHGLTAGTIEIPIHTDTVMLHNDVHFAIVERLTGIPVIQLQQLNPQYRTEVVPASTRSYALSLPADKASLFVSMEDSIYRLSRDTISRNAVVPVAANSMVYHKVRKGETFNSIAKKYGVSVSSLRRWNGKGKSSTLKVGTRLKVYLPTPKTQSTSTATPEPPAADSSSTAPDTTATAQPEAQQPKPKAAQPEYYTVRKGDNLSRIAARHHTTVQHLKQLNNLKSDAIRVGQRLRIK
ncbi:MAG: LysM peptidoglycan-binding domain-containing protein [Bacteroidales bacterium]|nr:LysM peptidoglycan-binding domain-containing protein [Bacteroidales bacterium]